MENKKRSTWTAITGNVSQAPCEDPKKTGQKALSQVKAIKEDAFIPKTPMAEDDEQGAYLNSWVFHPESIPRMSWDIMALLFIFYQAISVPYRICFAVPLTDGWAILEFIITICFMTDILLGFNTGFYSRGALVMNRKKIAKNYLKFWFWLDLLASLPYTWFIDGVFEEESQEETDSSDNIYKAPQLLRLIKIFRFLRILKLLRLAKLKRILIKIEDYIASNTLATLFVFFRLLSVVFFIAHWTACWWYFIGDQDSAIHPTTWVTDAKISNKSNFDKYITSLYWAFTTMTTVGYGDIVPFTVNEKVYAMFSMIVACGVFAYTVGSIGSLVSKQNAVENAYREQVVAVNRYMKKKDLPPDLRFRVRRYLEYVWENKKKNNLDEKQILGLLSEPLRDEIYAKIHGTLLILCSIFEQYEAHFISQLSRTLETETYGPGDTVIEEGEMSSKMFFIQNGKVDIFHQNTRSSFKVLEPREYFGEIAFFTEKPRCASARCLDYVDLLTLSRASMNMLLEKFPEAKETTDLLARKCEGGDYTALNILCYICKEQGHIAARCRKILLNLDHEDTKKKWLDQRKQSNTKYINPEVDLEPNYRRVPKPNRQIKFNVRNVKGEPKDTVKMFPEDPRLYPRIRRFLDSNNNLRSRTNSSTSVTSGNGENRLEHAQRRNRPRYSIIYRESEGEEEEEQGEQPDRPRSKKFRMSLIDRSANQQQQQNEEKPQKIKKSQVVPFNVPLMPIVTEEQQPDYDTFPVNMYDYEEIVDDEEG